MSGSLKAWYSLPDLESLARRKAVIETRVPYSRLRRFEEFAGSVAGEVKARLTFGDEGPERLSIRLELVGTVRLACQRCLEPVLVAYETDTYFAVTQSTDSAERLTDGFELLNLANDELAPEAFIEDELIVSMPLVPRHERQEDCGLLARRVEEHETRSADEALARDVRANH